MRYSAWRTPSELQPTMGIDRAKKSQDKEDIRPPMPVRRRVTVSWDMGVTMSRQDRHHKYRERYRRYFKTHRAIIHAGMKETTPKSQRAVQRGVTPLA